MSIKLSRRNLLKNMVVGGAVLGTSGLLKPAMARAAKRGYILIGRPDPQTGPLADFGEASPWVDDLVLKKINADSGIFIKEAGKKLPLKIKLVDTQSNPTLAGEVTQKLILKDEVDLMYVLHTPDTVAPVSAMCENLEVPCVSLDAPVSAWLSGGPFKWCYHSHWDDAGFIGAWTGMWDKTADQHNKTIGFLWQTDPDGLTFMPKFDKICREKGYKVIQPGQFPYGLKDFSSIISQFKKEKVEIVAGIMIPPDFTTFWRQSRQQGYRPKIATIGKAILFPSAVEALGGNLGDGLTCENWWSPNHPFKSSIDGTTPQQLCDLWTEATGKQWTPPIGFKYAGFEILFDVLKRAQTLEKEAILKAFSETRLDTIVGPIDYNDEHYCATPLVGGQWRKGTKFPYELDIVFNDAHPEIPLTGTKKITLLQ